MIDKIKYFNGDLDDPSDTTTLNVNYATGEITGFLPEDLRSTSACDHDGVLSIGYTPVINIVSHMETIDSHDYVAIDTAPFGDTTHLNYLLSNRPDGIQFEVLVGGNWTKCVFRYSYDEPAISHVYEGREQRDTPNNIVYTIKIPWNGLDFDIMYGGLVPYTKRIVPDNIVDYIVEKSKNDVWDIEKWESGKLVLSAEYYTDIKAPVAWGSALYKFETEKIQFPAGLFLQIPQITVSASNEEFYMVCGVNAMSPNSFSFYGCKPNADAEPVMYTVTAVGTWKE